MNLLDIAVLAVFAFFVLLGVYKGFLPTLISIGAYIVSWLLSFFLIPLGSMIVENNSKLFNMMLYYTEGSEYINDVELAKADISSISTAQLNDIISNAGLPYPMGKRISVNVATEAFSGKNVTTLGDYFNQTIVCVFINILVFLAAFILLRLIIAFVVNGVDYAWGLPSLRSGDRLLGGGLGLIRGILAVFLVSMLLPIVLTVLPIDFVKNLVNGSFFAPLFYHSNFLLSMMPGT